VLPFALPSGRGQPRLPLPHPRQARLPAETTEWQGGKHGEVVIDMDYIVNTHPVPDMVGEVRENMRRMSVKMASLGLAG
jgi:hypothetical protein